MELTQKIVKDFFDYNAETGILTWKFRERKYFKNKMAQNVANAKCVGKPFGCIDKAEGYVRGRIFASSYKAHRVIWLWMTGEWPKNKIDHANGVRCDNRWENLSDVSDLENAKNQKKKSHNTSGISNICKKDKKWVLQLTSNHKRFYKEGNCLGALIKIRNEMRISQNFTERSGK